MNREPTASETTSAPRDQLTDAASLYPWKVQVWKQEANVSRDVVIDCGWGRLIFAHTFASNEELSRVIQCEDAGCRDIALYVADPHVLLSLSPQELFLDPSHTYRLYFDCYYRASETQPATYQTRRVDSPADADAMNLIYSRRGMVNVGASFISERKDSSTIIYFIAEETETRTVIGTVTGVDHVRGFNDPERGTSLWALAVDPQTKHAGVGEALVTTLIKHFMDQGRRYVDLSVMHDNSQAISLYEKLGFERVPVFCVKNRNEINEPLFLGQVSTELNSYGQIIAREAQRRGISVHVIDAQLGFFALSFGGRNIVCRESLSELTSAIAMSRCDDKRMTYRALKSAGLHLPEQIEVGSRRECERFLTRHQRVVVKPARGEQGRGVSVDIATPEAMFHAIETAQLGGVPVVLEQMIQGLDLRIVVIDFRVAAAAVRRPPEVTGDAHHTIRQLIERQSRRREAATQGESRIPIDEETARCVAEAGYQLDDVLPCGLTVTVRKAANLHCGGTIHDVTEELHPKLVEVSKRAAEVLDIPVVGLDLIVPSARSPEYAIIEANERPGLANHEPQPTAARFLDLLFPQTVSP